MDMRLPQTDEERMRLEQGVALAVSPVGSEEESANTISCFHPFSQASEAVAGGGVIRTMTAC